MATPYQGNPAASAHSPSAAPGPSTSPTINIPADTDPNNSATMFQQQHQVEADYIAYVQAILNGRPAWNPVSGSAMLASNVPQIALRDAAGNVKNTYDYLGFRLGSRILELTENWVGYTTAISTATKPIPAFPQWQLGVSSGTLSFANPTSTYPSPMAALALPNTGGGYTSILTASQIAYLRSDTSIVAEVDVQLTSTSGAWQFGVGLDADFPLLDSSDSAVLITASNSATNWQAKTQSGTLSSTLDLGVAVTTAVTQLRIEFHGASSPYGACARFFVNGALRGTITTNLPTGVGLFFGSIGKSLDTTGGRFAQIGGVKVAANRFASSPGL